MNINPVEITINGTLYFYRARLEASHVPAALAEVVEIIVENLDGDIIQDGEIEDACARDALANFDAEPDYALPRREWQG